MTEVILTALRSFQQYTSGLQGLLQKVQRGMPAGTEGQDAGGAVTVRSGPDGLPEAVTFARDWQRRCRPEAIGGALNEAYGAAMSASMTAMQQAMEGMDVRGCAETLKQDMERRERDGFQATPPGSSVPAPPTRDAGAPSGDPGAPRLLTGIDPGAPNWPAGGAPRVSSGMPWNVGPGASTGPLGPSGPPTGPGGVGPLGPPDPGAPGGTPGSDSSDPIEVSGRDLRYVIPRPLDELAEEMMAAFDTVSRLDLESLADTQVEGRGSGGRVTVVLSRGAFHSCQVDASWAAGKSAMALGQAVEAALADGRAALARLEESSKTDSQQRQMDGLLDEALTILRNPQRFAGEF